MRVRVWYLEVATAHTDNIPLAQLFLGFVFPDRVSLHRPGCPGTHFCRQNWHQTQGPSFFCLMGAETKGMYHHTWPSSKLSSAIKIPIWVKVCCRWALCLWYPRTGLEAPRSQTGDGNQTDDGHLRYLSASAFPQSVTKLADYGDLS